VDDMKRLRSRAFKAREVCADFEELRCLPMNCQRKDIPDEGPRGEVERAVGLEGDGGGMKWRIMSMLLLYGILRNSQYICHKNTTRTNTVCYSKLLYNY